MHIPEQIIQTYFSSLFGVDTFIRAKDRYCGLVGSKYKNTNKGFNYVQFIYKLHRYLHFKFTLSGGRY